MRKRETPYTLDNKTTREVYLDMKKRGYITGMRYDTYLGRLQERHLAARREEWNERRMNIRYTKQYLMN